MKRVLVLAVVAVPLAGCDGGRQPPNITEIAEEVGCVEPEMVDTDELFVREMATCDGGGTLRTFASNDARDNWLEIAEEFGGVYGKGDFYTIEEP